MSWSYPSYFWAMLMVLPAIGAAWHSTRSARRHLEHIGVHGIEWQVRSYLRNASMIGFVALVVLAGAEPRGGRRPVTGERSGLDVAVAFDASRSMLSRDLEPDRLTRGTTALRQISGNLDNSRFSLVPFKGDAIVSVPMTEDRVVFNMWIDRLGPGLLSTPGTDLEKALRTARQSFPAGAGRKRVILLVSDGESLEGNVRSILRELQDEGIPVHVLVAGTSGGGTIPLADGTLLRDESGHPVVTRADTASLAGIADDTGGSFHSMDRPGSVNALISAIDNDRIFAETKGIRFVGVHRYRLFLLPAVILLFVYLFSRIVPWRRR